MDEVETIFTEDAISETIHPHKADTMRRNWYKFLGMIEWAITFVNKKGNISHSSHGFLFYGADEEWAGLDDEGRAFVKDYIMYRYGRKGDISCAYHIWFMYCDDEEE